jgi:glycerate kinase
MSAWAQRFSADGAQLLASGGFGTKPLQNLTILVAPDGFKGSLDARQAAEAITRGILSVVPSAEVVALPLSDGGEGFLDILVASSGAQLETLATTNALGERIAAAIAVLDGGQTVAIELSSAAGIAQLAPHRRDPMRTTTFGVGTLIARAYERYGFTRLLLALGGSATVDGGTGLLEALGVKFLDAAGLPIARGGGGLGLLTRVDISMMHPALRTEIIVAVDVENPLVGPDGAAAVYGPQKGATPAQVEILDANLRMLATALAEASGKQVQDLPGTGSAGGVPAGLLALTGARLVPGFELAAEAQHLDAYLGRARAVFTGEGQLDSQSFQGKVVGRLANRCQAAGVPLVALVGRLTPGGEQELAARGGVAFSLASGPMTYEQAVLDAATLLEAAAARATRALRLANPSWPL